MSQLTRSTFDLPAPDGRRLLLAASTGGHLSQLVRLAPGLGARDDSVWVTFRTPQSESMLEGRNVIYVPYIRPRDTKAVVKAYSAIRDLVKTQRFDGAVSTGAGLALAALPAARLSGVPTLYIESVSRVQGASLSGRLLAGSGFCEMRTQHPGWAGHRWGVHPSVLETYCSVPADSDPTAAARPLKVFVTLGTIEGYPFDSLVDRMLEQGLADEHTQWQLGSTSTRRDLPGTVHSMVGHAEFQTAMREADVVVTHAGVGTIMGLLEAGIYPVAVVRRQGRGEHVDDHQAQIAALLRRLEIGEGIEVGDLDAETLRRAARLRVRSAAVVASTGTTPATSSLALAASRRQAPLP